MQHTFSPSELLGFTERKSRTAFISESLVMFFCKELLVLLFLLTLRKRWIGQIMVGCGIKSDIWHHGIFWNDKKNTKTDGRFVRKLLLLLIIYWSHFSPTDSLFLCQLKQHSVDLLANKEIQNQQLSSSTNWLKGYWLSISITDKYFLRESVSEFFTFFNCCK